MYKDSAIRAEKQENDRFFLFHLRLLKRFARPAVLNLFKNWRIEEFIFAYYVFLMFFAKKGQHLTLLMQVVIKKCVKYVRCLPNTSHTPPKHLTYHLTSHFT